MYCWGNDGNDAEKRKLLAEMGVDAIIADSFQSFVCCYTLSFQKGSMTILPIDTSPFFFEKLKTLLSQLDKQGFARSFHWEDR